MDNPTMGVTKQQDFLEFEELPEELDFEDQSFLKELVAKESFSARDVTLDTEYRCVQSCEICEREPHTSLGLGNEQYYKNLDFRGNENDFSFPREKRRRLIKICAHEYFEKKWREQGLKKSSSEAFSSRNDLKRKVPKPLKMSPYKGNTNKSLRVANESHLNCHEVEAVQIKTLPLITCNTSEDVVLTKPNRISERLYVTCQGMTESVPKETRMSYPVEEISDDEDSITLPSTSRTLENETPSTGNQLLRVTTEGRTFNRPTTCLFKDTNTLSANSSDISKKKINSTVIKDFTTNEKNYTLKISEERKSKRFYPRREEPYRNTARVSKGRPCRHEELSNKLIYRPIRRNVNVTTFNSSKHRRNPTANPIENKYKFERRKNYQTKTNSELDRCNVSNEICLRVPMEDRNSPFFIDKKMVNVELYQEGLAEKQWNPTQVLFEICSKCQWQFPDYQRVPMGVGFQFSVTVQDKEFTWPTRANTKKEANHFASCECLKYMGFQFQYKP